MLSNIVKNSQQLIKSQCNDDDSLLHQIIRLKNKNTSFFEPTRKRGSIFQEPDFSNKFDLDRIKKKNRTYFTSQTQRIRSTSEGSKNLQKLKITRSAKQSQYEDIKLTNGDSINHNETSTIIHSRKNNEWVSSNKNSKIHHERVLKSQRFMKNNQIIEQPGFANLCFYKNTLQQIQNVRSARLSSRKKNNIDRSDKQRPCKNRIKFIKYKGILTDQNPQCRPWSPKNDSQLNDGDFQNMNSDKKFLIIFPFQYKIEQNESYLASKQKQSHFIQIYQVPNSAMKSFSKTFNVPLGQTVYQSQQLLQTMQELLKRQQQIMTQKLMREEEIQLRLKRLQKSFQQEVHRKQQKIRLKLEKSQKNRHEFLEKIVKRCKDKDKVYDEKIKTTTTKKKQSLRQAWKAATKFNQKILSTKNMRHRSFDREPIQITETQDQNLAKSFLVPENFANEEGKQFLLLQSSPGVNIRTTKVTIDSSLANRSLLKSVDPTLMQSTFNFERKLEKYNKPLNTEHAPREQDQINESQNPQNSYQEKLRKTLGRHHKHMMDEENKKIQQYGERLEKINLSRRKRDQLHKSRLKRSSMQNDGSYYEEQSQQKSPKKVKKSNERLKSQSQSYNKARRASDWSELNKQRRQQLLNVHLQQGNQYLSENKIRYLKQIMSKNIAYNALQRKLFNQRLRHVV